VALPDTLGAHDATSDHVYITNVDGLIAVDVSDPTTPVQVGFVTTEDRAVDVVVRENHAFVADDDAGVAVIDIRDPRHMHQVGGWYGSDRVFDFAVVEDLLVVNTGENGHDTFILEISDPRNPIEVRRLELGIRELQIVGNRAYAIGGKIAVLDLAWPAQPVLQEIVGLVGGGHSGTVSGPLVVASGNRIGLQVFRGCHLAADFDHQVDGDTVHFQDTTAGTPESWFWDFGDGSTSAERHPSHSYDGDCGYSVTLRAANDHGHHITSRRVVFGGGLCEGDLAAVD